MGHVDSSQITPLYANTTPGLTADANVFDPAIAALIVAINENFDSFEAFKASIELPIPDQSIVTRHLRNLAVTNPKLAPLAVTADKIADGTITTAKLADLVITAAKIADGTITEPKYATGSVSTRAIAPQSITASKLDPSIVGSISDAGVLVKFGLIDEQLKDIWINVKFPPAPFLPLVGNGVVDETVKLQGLVNYAITNHKKLYMPNGGYVISDTLLVEYTMGEQYNALLTGFEIIGENTAQTKILSKVVGTVNETVFVSGGTATRSTIKPTVLIKTVNNESESPSIKLSNFSVIPFDDTYTRMIRGIELENTVGVMLEDVYIDKCTEGLILKIKNGGYTEMNKFNRVRIEHSKSCIVYESQSQMDSSFHGNKFENCGAQTTKYDGVEGIILDMRSGFIYNNRFELRTFFNDSCLMYINAGGAYNTGYIYYETYNSSTSIKTKIRTGFNDNAVFLFDGVIHGIGNTVGSYDWSEYAPSSTGREKLICNNLVRNIALPNIKNSRNVHLRSGGNDLIDSYENGSTSKNILRYQSDDGEENGWIFSAVKYSDTPDAAGRAVFGLTPHDGTMDDLVPGFDVHLDGSKIVSKTKSSNIEFQDGYLSRENKKIYDAETCSLVRAGVVGSVHQPNGLIEAFGIMNYTTPGVDTTLTQNLTSFGISFPINPQITFLGSAYATVRVVSLTATLLTIQVNSASSGNIYYRILGV